MKAYDFNIVNEYISIHLNKSEETGEWFYEFYLDDRFSWNYHTDSILEFVGIVYFSPFRNNEKVREIEILKGNKDIDINNSDSYYSFIYWITGGNRIYMQTPVSFKDEVYPNLPDYRKHVFRALEESDTVGELMDKLTIIIEKANLEAAEMIAMLESEE